MMIYSLCFGMGGKFIISWMYEERPFSQRQIAQMLVVTKTKVCNELKSCSCDFSYIICHMYRAIIPFIFIVSVASNTIG